MSNLLSRYSFDPLRKVPGDGFHAFRRGICAGQAILFDAAGVVWNRPKLEQTLAGLLTGLPPSPARHIAEQRLRAALVRLAIPPGHPLPHLVETTLQGGADGWMAVGRCWTCEAVFHLPSAPTLVAAQAALRPWAAQHSVIEGPV